MSQLVEKPRAILLDVFQDHASLPANTYVDAVRQDAAKALENRPFPTLKTEDWKYTRVTVLAKQKLRLPKSNSEVSIPQALLDLSSITVVLENGQFRADKTNLAQANGIVICSLKQAMQEHSGLIESHFSALTPAGKSDVFTLMNTAFAPDGVFIYAAANASLNIPIHIISISSEQDVLAQPRVLIIGEQNSKAIVWHSFIGKDSGLTNVVTEVSVALNACISLHQLQNEEGTANHINSLFVHQERDSRFRSSATTLGGALVRNNISIESNGENCDTNLSGVYFPTGSQHCDNHTLVRHLQPNCESDELYKGIISDQATAVFNGKVYVDQKAQKTNAYQSNANILLSDDATVNSKPELEIYADDVKCSHGTTTGQMDEEAVFYLRSRGLGLGSARKLLLSGMLAEVLERLEGESFHDYIKELLDKKLNEV